MSKKLVCLVLAMLMLATIALAEVVGPSRTTTAVTVLSTTGEVTTEKVTDEETIATVDESVTTMLNSVVETGDFSGEMFEDVVKKAEDFGIDLENVDPSSAVASEATKVSAKAGSSMEVAKDAALNEFSDVITITVSEDGTYDLVETETSADSLTYTFAEDVDETLSFVNMGVKE